MILSSLPLVSWVNGTIMIALFALVSIGLISVVYFLMKTDKKKKE